MYSIYKFNLKNKQRAFLALYSSLYLILTVAVQKRPGDSPLFTSQDWSQMPLFPFFVSAHILTFLFSHSFSQSSCQLSVAINDLAGTFALVLAPECCSRVVNRNLQYHCPCLCSTVKHLAHLFQFWYSSMHSINPSLSPKHSLLSLRKE